MLTIPGLTGYFHYWHHHNKPKEFVLHMGLKQKLDFDFSVDMLTLTERIRFYTTDTKRAINYVEYTPYNKGNLWKIRRYYNHYDLYYGTIKKAYCTTLGDCIKFIASA